MPNSPVRLHVVTGKGGTGKTTVAAALAVALASGGKRVLLTEVEGRQGIAQLFDVAPLPYQERQVAVAPGHGEVLALPIDPQEALLDYLDMFYNLRRAGKLLKRLGAIDFATTIAPGMRDVLLTGKVKEAVDRVQDGRPVYDAVVLDAPPTGRITRFLNVTDEVGTLTKVGPVKGQADSVMRVLRSAQTKVHLVTILEEMPVQETVDGVADLARALLPVGHVIVNMRRVPYAVPSPLDPAEVTAGLAAVGIRSPKATVSGLVAGLVGEASDYATRLALEARETSVLATLGRPTATLPLLPGRVDPGALYRLAELLSTQGVAG